MLTATKRLRFRPLLEILEDRSLPSATYAATVLGDSPTAFWRLGETSGTTAVSQVGAPGTNGTYVGAGIQLGQAGAIVADTDTAVGFSGAANSGVTVPPTVVNFGGFTQESFEVWFRVNPGNGGVILGQVGNAGVPPGSGAFSGWVPAVYIDTTGVVRAEMFWHGFVGPIQSGPGFNDGNWHHLVNVFDNGTETLYIDGVQRASAGPGLVQSPYAGGPANYSYYLGAGVTNSWPGGNGDWFYLNGTLDEAAVYQNTALSLAQIQNHFATGRANDVSFRMGAYAVREDAGTAQVAITRSGDLTRADSVLFSTVAGGTAVAGVDYAAVTNQVVTFAVGQATANATVPILNRPGIQPDRTVNLALTRNGASAIVFPTAAAVLTIVEVTPTTTLLAVGAGGAPHVQVFDAATMAPRFSFYAYAAAFSGGVLVAVGDVTGDGIDDIITGAGPGGGPHVKVFDGTNGAEIRSFMAYGINFSGGVNVAAGDVDGDGRADIITGSATSSSHVKVFSGATGAEIRSFFAYPGYNGGVTVAGGDVDGDGRADIITGTATSSSHVKVFSGLNNAELLSFFAYPGYDGGVNVAAGDLNRDGRVDIITGTARSSSHVKAFSGTNQAELASFFAYPGYDGGVTVGSGDVNTDGGADIITGSARSSSHVKVFRGSTLDTLMSFFALEPAFNAGVFVA